MATAGEKQSKIRELLGEHNAKLFAHTYQIGAIQEIADVLGDSLRLAMVAADETDAEFIIYAAVTFMAETASIINQDKHILMPVRNAVCPMANHAPAKVVREFKAKHPGLPVVLYVNTLAEAKAEADITCTSSNAIPIVEAIAEEFGVSRVLFGPDRHLGRFVQERTGIETIIMPPTGHCYVHQQFAAEDVLLLKESYPEGFVIAHPECPKDVIDLADYAGSTGQMFNFAKNDPKHDIYLVATEIGIISHMKREMPQKTFIPILDTAICSGMKSITLDNLLFLLEHREKWEEFEVKIGPEIAQKARKAIDRMIEISKQLGL